MTWEEIVELFISFGERVHVIRGDGLDAVSFQLVPVAWFISLRSSGELSMGIYEGDDKRLVGTRSIPFAELTPDFLRAEISKALAEQTSLMLDPDAVREFLQALRRRF